MKKVLSLLLTVFLIIGIVPVLAQESQSIVYSNFTYRIIDEETVMITGLVDKGAQEITIPALIEGRKVKLSASVFKEALFTTVYIEEGIEEIPFEAFKNCDRLTGISFPNSVTKIADDAFMLCDNLKYVIFPEEGSLSIGRDAFYACKSIEEVEITKAVTLIDGSFDSCSNLKSVIFPKEGELQISWWSFSSCKKIKEITFTGAIKYVNDAFPLTEITTINLDKNFTADCVESGVFGKETERINVEEGNERYYSINGVLYDKSTASLVKFPDKMQAESYSIPSDITNIHPDAFSGKTE